MGPAASWTVLPFEALHVPIPGSKPLQPVPGLGDQAYWWQVHATNGMLHIVSGTDFLTIQTFGKGPGAGTLETTREIGEIGFNRFRERFPAS